MFVIQIWCKGKQKRLICQENTHKLHLNAIHKSQFAPFYIPSQAKLSRTAHCYL